MVSQVTEDNAITTSSTHSELLGGRLTDEDEQGSANQLRQILASQISEGTDEVSLQIIVDDEPTTIALHRSLSELLVELLRVVASGDAVTLVPVHQQLTTHQSADILNVCSDQVARRGCYGSPQAWTTSTYTGS